VGVPGKWLIGPRTTPECNDQILGEKGNIVEVAVMSEFHCAMSDYHY
jgi:hypothetical protein